MSERKAFPLRLSPELYEEIRRWADADLRSVNGQIEFLLREAVARRRADRRAVGPGHDNVDNSDDETGGPVEPPVI